MCSQAVSKKFCYFLGTTMETKENVKTNVVFHVKATGDDIGDVGGDGED